MTRDFAPLLPRVPSSLSFSNLNHLFIARQLRCGPASADRLPPDSCFAVSFHSLLAATPSCLAVVRASPSRPQPGPLRSVRRCCCGASFAATSYPFVTAGHANSPLRAPTLLSECHPTSHQKFQFRAAAFAPASALSLALCRLATLQPPGRHVAGVGSRPLLGTGFASLAIAIMRAKRNTCPQRAEGAEKVELRRRTVAGHELL